MVLLESATAETGTAKRTTTAQISKLTILFIHISPLAIGFMLVCAFAIPFMDFLALTRLDPQLPP
jgi:hypothetical protein